MISCDKFDYQVNSIKILIDHRRNSHDKKEEYTLSGIAKEEYDKTQKDCT